MTESTERTDGARQILRHALATLAYRAAKVLRDFPPEAVERRVSPATRTPLAIVSHLGELMRWAAGLARGVDRWRAEPTESWWPAVDRFFRLLSELDEAIAQASPEARPPEAIFQAPIADALTHVGQLALLRGMAAK